RSLHGLLDLRKDISQLQDVMKGHTHQHDIESLRRKVESVEVHFAKLDRGDALIRSRLSPALKRNGRGIESQHRCKEALGCRVDLLVRGAASETQPTAAFGDADAPCDAHEPVQMWRACDLGLNILFQNDRRIEPALNGVRGPLSGGLVP